MEKKKNQSTYLKLFLIEINNQSFHLIMFVDYLLPVALLVL